jgi:hypothetical protein
MYIYVFWRALEWTMMVIWNILRPFCTLSGHFLYFACFWYILPRKSGNPVTNRKATLLTKRKHLKLLLQDQDTIRVDYSYSANLLKQEDKAMQGPILYIFFNQPCKYICMIHANIPYNNTGIITLHTYVQKQDGVCKLWKKLASSSFYDSCKDSWI